MSKISLQSPAKLNLYLKVLSKRPDGYHNIRTLFERINLCDNITLSSKVNNKITIQCNHPQVPTGTKNLAYKAAQMLQSSFMPNKGVHIRIHKRIPVAAGLAGGSSNAATVLLGLNKLWRLNLTKQQLLNCARKIGSDVAFFLHNMSWGLGTERGDRVKKVDIRQKYWHILVVPRIKMYSWKVYGGMKLRLSHSSQKRQIKGSSGSKLTASNEKDAPNTNVLTRSSDSVNILIHRLRFSSVSEISRLLSNDLEPTIIRLCPKLLNLKRIIKSISSREGIISGSGPSVFGLVETEKEAQHFKKKLSKRFKQVYVVRTF